MTRLEKHVLYYSLFAFYHPLLTPKQEQYFQYYFINNLSLQEISQILKVSRTAVHDSLQKVITLLNNYESKLHLYQKYQARNQIYQQYVDADDLISQLQAIDKISESVMK